MNSIESCLRDEATWIAQRWVKDKAEAELAAIRASIFNPKIGTQYQCPACWVRKEKRAALEAIPTRTKDDAFECDACGADYLIPR